MAFARTVIETELVCARMDVAAEQIPRIAELYDSLKWLIARDPQAGTPIPGSNPPRRIAKTFTWKPGGCPAVMVIYSQTENEVVIEGSRISF